MISPGLNEKSASQYDMTNYQVELETFSGDVTLMEAHQLKEYTDDAITGMSGDER